MHAAKSDRDPVSPQMEIIELLDERARLREDPERRDDLTRIHARLREIVRRYADRTPPEAE